MAHRPGEMKDEVSVARRPPAAWARLAAIGHAGTPDLAAYASATALLFLLLFGPKTLTGSIDLLSIGCLISVLLWRRMIPLVFDTAEFWATALASLYIIVVLVVTGVPDMWWGLKAPRVLLNYVGVFVFVTYAIERFGERRMLQMFHNAVFAHAIIILAMAFIPAFNQVVASAFGGVTKSTFQISGLTRGLALPAIVMMFPFVTYPLFAMQEGYRERFISLKLLTILTATFFMGRTGFYLCLAAASAIMVVMGLRSVRALRQVVAIAVMAVVVGSTLVSAAILDDSWIDRIPGVSRLAEPLRHTLEPFRSYASGSGLSVRSVEHIWSMPVIYHNQTSLQVAFGTGLYGRGDRWTHLPTDVAYLHMFSAFGVAGLGLMIFAYLITLPRYRSLDDTAVYWATACVVAMTLVANLKETALFTRNIYTLHVMLLAWLAYEYRARSHSRPS